MLPLPRRKKAAACCLVALVDVGRGAKTEILAAKWGFPTEPREAKIQNASQQQPCCSAQTDTQTIVLSKRASNSAIARIPRIQETHSCVTAYAGNMTFRKRGPARNKLDNGKLLARNQGDVWRPFFPKGPAAKTCFHLVKTPGKTKNIFPVVINSFQNQQGKVTHILKQMEACTACLRRGAAAGPASGSAAIPPQWHTLQQLEGWIPQSRHPSFSTETIYCPGVWPIFRGE